VEQEQHNFNLVFYILGGVCNSPSNLITKMLKIKNKKGVLGLETVGAVIITLLILAVIAIATFLALDSLANSGALSTTRTVSVFVNFGNDTINLNDTPTQPATVAGLTGVVYTGLLVTNASNNTAADLNVTEGNFCSFYIFLSLCFFFL